MSACNCMGPQLGQPVCPCEMDYVKVVGGRYIYQKDLGPAPIRSGVQSILDPTTMTPVKIFTVSGDDSEEHF